MRSIPPMLVLVLAACQGGGDWKAEEAVGDRLVKVAGAEAGVNRPQDLDFNPERPGELWVVNKRDDSVTIVEDAFADAPNAETIYDPYALHFLAEVSSIAFGAPGTFGTCQDSRNTYNDATSGDDFMGPALWSSDLDVFGESNPEAVDYLSGMFGMPVDLGSHLDMLHESPLCIGIAWEQANVYWVFDGLDGAIVRYDFHEDHGPGYDDHSDGEIARYVSGELKRVKGSVGHMELDRETGWLYVADPGNARVVRLDTRSGTRGADLPVEELGTDHYRMDDATLEVVVADGLVEPGGLALVDDHLVITDRGTGHILVFTMEGELVHDLDTELGENHLGGIVGDTLDDLWFVDMKGDQVLRLQP